MKEKKWTLFLDRDGVINVRLPNRYVKSWNECQFTYRCLEAMKVFYNYFETIVVVTNQQGIGKGIMTVEELDMVHHTMIIEVKKAEGQIDKVYYCPNLKEDNSPNRKPNIGMGLQAKRDFPAIDFQKSIMVGDSFSDIEFGWQLGMKTIFIEGKEEERARTANIPVDGRFENLWEMSEALESLLLKWQ